MEDRFRFRVWFTPDYQEPEMIYDAEQTYDNRCQNKGSYHHWYFGEILEDKDCIVMQCTGLKDKNGKLIYEGDIVKQNKTMYCVTWEEGSYGFCDIRTKITYTVGYVMSKKQEVIGNIYENPELLEG